MDLFLLFADEETDLNSSELPDDIKKRQCQICNKLLSTQFSKERHMLLHTGEKPFKCTVEGCNRRFIQKSGKREKYCDVVCSFTLENDITHIFIPSFSDLNAHIKVHERQPENRHKRCPWCPLTFKHEINYQRHMKTHKKTTQQISGVFTCDFCAKVFTSSKGAYSGYTLQ